MKAASGEFRFQPGPIFGNLILADEINRAPAKVQAALLEAMEERQVTVGGTTHPLPASLPGARDAEPDRAGRDVSAPRSPDRPLPAACRDPLSRCRRRVGGAASRTRRGGASRTGEAHVETVIPQQAIFDARAEIQLFFIAEAVERYIVALISATRRPST